MSLDNALTVAAEIKVIRDRIRDAQSELSEVNTRRATLQSEIADLQAALVTKRQEFRNEASNA